MYKALGVLPFLLSLVLVGLTSEALYLRASGHQRPDWGARLPPGPVHEVDRDAAAGAMFT